MSTSEAARPGSAAPPGPDWLRTPDDANWLLPTLWPANAARGADGALQVAGVPVEQIARDHGTPVFVVDEDDFRSRARAFRDAFTGSTVYYAGKAFLCVEVARWVAQEGLHLDVCSAGELRIAELAGVPPERLAFHGNNKSVPELARAVDLGVGRIVVDSTVEIERLSTLAAARGTLQPVLLRVTTGVAAHTHAHIATAHEDQKFGFLIAGGHALAAAQRIIADPHLDLRGLHSHIGSQIFDTSGFEVAARRVLALHAVIAERGYTCPELGLGGGFGIAYTSKDDARAPANLAADLRSIVEQECVGLGIETPRLSVEPGRAIAGPSTFTLYGVGTVKQVPLEVGARTYVCVDGGMSDNIRAALYAADYSCTLASRASDAAPTLARVVGKHCESGDVVVKDEFLPGDVAPGDLLAVPGTGAYCRSLASNYNHVPRPGVVAVRSGRAKVIVRRETEDDLLRLDIA